MSLKPERDPRILEIQSYTGTVINYTEENNRGEHKQGKKPV